jgi:uncharacterized protein with PIN domain
MRFLADENLPGLAVFKLRALGHDVAWIRSDAPGASDTTVLAIAARDGRILLTFDKDFGELARSVSLPAECGVILFRLPMPRLREATRLAEIISARTDWTGRFSVVEPGRVRMRQLR